MENKIEKLRKEKKLSQQKLANLCSVSRQTINAIENDKYSPSLELAFKLSRVLSTSVDKLFIYKEK